jgi:hypothetical protein
LLSLGERSCFSVMGPVNVKLFEFGDVFGVPANPPDLELFAGDELGGPAAGDKRAAAGEAGLMDGDSEPLDFAGIASDAT